MSITTTGTTSYQLLPNAKSRCWPWGLTTLGCNRSTPTSCLLRRLAVCPARRQHHLHLHLQRLQVPNIRHVCATVTISNTTHRSTVIVIAATSTTRKRLERGRRRRRRRASRPFSRRVKQRNDSANERRRWRNSPGGILRQRHGSGRRRREKRRRRRKRGRRKRRRACKADMRETLSWIILAILTYSLSIVPHLLLYLSLCRHRHHHQHAGAPKEERTRTARPSYEAWKKR